MQALEHSAYLALREGAEVLEADSHGDKVLRLPDGAYLKLFRRKRLLSSAAIWPYAQRFADNTKALQTRGIPCPEIIELYRIASIERDAVHYAPLPGQTLRQLIQQEIGIESLRAQLGEFVAKLHACGIYFRSLHLGNIVLTPENTFGLIDIADMKFLRRPLHKGQRVRNFQHMLRYSIDKQWLLSAPLKPNGFFDSYLTHSQLQMELSALIQIVDQHA
ncbi:MAG: toluene tolerance protein [Pseudomonas sp.]|uniref:toluene tolerance protein n=1 Tax=Pseudomonas sp. TaxID=306 RepID=UPI002733E000|nr:toluene tolerance protein [Pseudomonas sp.]MDP3845674.1 toluene tolerance protein [Pseudomonas sp.]